MFRLIVAILEEIGKMRLIEQTIQVNKELARLTSPEIKSLGKLVGPAEMALSLVMEKLEEFIPPSFAYWITTENDGITSINWQWIEGENGGHIGRLVNDSLLSLMESVHLVDWAKQIELSQEQAAKFQQLADHVAQTSSSKGKGR